MSGRDFVENPDRGWIVPIGGAEEKTRDPAILEQFVGRSGGRKARVAIIPTASRLEDTGPRYRELFRDLGVRSAEVLPFESRTDCERKEWLDVLAKADAVFLTGGNQLKLSTTIGGTRVGRVLRERNAAGMTIAGTSAGAAYLCEHMIAYGDEGSTPRADMVQLAPGLGLTNTIVVDQHFRQRDRLGRLLTALAYNPFATGVGLDEDTAAFIAPDETLEVIGSGAITVVDPSELTYSSMDSARRHDPVCLIDIRMHVLIEGGTYNTQTRKAAAKLPERRSK